MWGSTTGTVLSRLADRGEVNCYFCTMAGRQLSYIYKPTGAHLKCDTSLGTYHLVARDGATATTLAACSPLACTYGNSPPLPTVVSQEHVYNRCNSYSHSMEGCAAQAPPSTRLEMAVVNPLLYTDTSRWMLKHGKAMRPKLTEQQQKELEDCFALMDLDGSGSINADELHEAFGLLGIKMSHKQTQEVLQLVDRDGTGELEWGEFLEVMTHTLKVLAGRGTGRGKTQLPFALMCTAYRRKRYLESVLCHNKEVVSQLASLAYTGERPWKVSEGIQPSPSQPAKVMRGAQEPVSHNTSQPAKAQQTAVQLQAHMIMNTPANAATEGQLEVQHDNAAAASPAASPRQALRPSLQLQNMTLDGHLIQNLSAMQQHLVAQAAINRISSTSQPVGDRNWSGRATPRLLNAVQAAAALRTCCGSSNGTACMEHTTPSTHYICGGSQRSPRSSPGISLRTATPHGDVCSQLQLRPGSGNHGGSGRKSVTPVVTNNGTIKTVSRQRDSSQSPRSNGSMNSRQSGRSACGGRALYQPASPRTSYREPAAIRAHTAMNTKRPVGDLLSGSSPSGYAQMMPSSSTCPSPHPSPRPDPSTTPPPAFVLTSSRANSRPASATHVNSQHETSTSRASCVAATVPALDISHMKAAGTFMFLPSSPRTSHTYTPGSSTAMSPRTATSTQSQFNAAASHQGPAEAMSSKLVTVLTPRSYRASFVESPYHQQIMESPRALRATYLTHGTLVPQSMRPVSARAAGQAQADKAAYVKQQVMGQPNTQAPPSPASACQQPCSDNPSAASGELQCGVSASCSAAGSEQLQPASCFIPKLRLDLITHANDMAGCISTGDSCPQLNDNPAIEQQYHQQDASMQVADGQSGDSQQLQAGEQEGMVHEHMDGPTPPQGTEGGFAAYMRAAKTHAQAAIASHQQTAAAASNATSLSLV